MGESDRIDNIFPIVMIRGSPLLRRQKLRCLTAPEELVLEWMVR